MIVNNFQSFAMFSEAGDRAVAGIVARARENRSTWPEVYSELRALADSDPENFGEAMDTAVREEVYEALNFDTNFYF
jgi:hypothetical protein